MLHVLYNGKHDNNNKCVNFYCVDIVQEFLHRVEAFEESKRASLQATVKDGEMQVKKMR